MYKGCLENQIVRLAWESLLLLVSFIGIYPDSNFWGMEKQKNSCQKMLIVHSNHPGFQ